ncbi:hypothetical protein LO80_08975 [Candidatus Francisella endociliophora]|uniref:chitinase n=1 Tax=Candidatus Francisella endociliophora TaxID=653937 RepID=A0A097ER91_9GAMM|nr:glycosyl hydrolase family 18 protein [Francisella sp. FSC1006]AIT10090.1 hypothetical protein LO80_08975 [Francisella sp. FSC1006]
MNTKIKLLSAVTLILMGSSVFANNEGEWSASNLKNYDGGDIVTVGNKKYQCTTDIHASKWCQLAAYKPNGIYGDDAWNEISNSDPDPDPQPNPDPTPTPDPQPNPDPSSCDTPPEDVAEFIPQGPKNWSGYAKDAFIKFEGAIYQLTDWWTASSPKQDSDWKLCSADVNNEVAFLSIKIPERPNYISEDEKPDIVIFKHDGNNRVEVAEKTDANWGETLSLQVVPGELEVYIPNIDGNIGSANPANISIEKDQTKDVKISFQAAAPAEEGSLTIKFNSSTSPNSLVRFTVFDEDNNIVKSDFTDFSSPIIFDDLPAQENGTKYKVVVDSYTQGNFKYSAEAQETTVYRHNNSNVEFNFESTPLETNSVKFNTSGLPEGKKLILNISSSDGDSQEFIIDANGENNFEVPQNGKTYTITATHLSGLLVKISDTTFTADGSDKVINVNIQESGPASDTIAATYFSLWGGNTSYSVDGKQIVTKPVSIDLQKYPDYCQNTSNPDRGLCDYNVLIMAFIITGDDGKMKLALANPGPGGSSDTYNDANIKAFISYMKNQGKHVLVSIGGQYFHMNWDTFNSSGKKEIMDIIDKYGFDGLDIDLEGHAIPNNTADLQSAIAGFKDIVNHYRNEGIDFWLTAAPEWPYIIPYTYGTGQYASHSYANGGYIELMNGIGMDKFNYVWPQMYNQGPANGITGYEKDANGYYKKVVPSDGMAKFLASMAWQATDEGFAANAGDLDRQVRIPLNKFVLGIPATGGAAGGNDIYVATPSDIAKAWDLMQQQNSVAAGFMDWSADFDAMTINDGDLKAGYSHTPWSTVKAIISK